MGHEAFNKQKGKGITSTEQARKLGAMGAKKSLETKRKKKLFKQIINDIMDQPATKEMEKVIQKSFGANGVDLTLKEAMVYAQVVKAIKKQDTQAFNALVDRVDGKPVQDTKIEHKGPLVKIIRDDIPRKN